MKTLRVLGALALGAALVAPFTANAQQFPNKPITLVLPLGAGGSHDLHARGITSIMGDILGQPMVVKLVPGGAGMKGTTLVAKAKPDGYTIIFTHNGFDQLVPQTRKVSFDARTAFRAIARINQAQPILVARADQPYKTVAEFIAYVKKNPGKVNMGHSGVWGAAYIPTVQLLKSAGIIGKVNLIPHKGGGPTLRALLSGDDQISFLFDTQTRPHFKAGKVNVLAVAGNEKIKDDTDFGNVPTMASLGHPSVAFTMERIFMAPAGIPEDRLEVLRAGFVKLLDNKSFLRFMRSIQQKVDFQSGADYDKKRPARFQSYTDLIKAVTSK